MAEAMLGNLQLFDATLQNVKGQKCDPLPAQSLNCQRIEKIAGRSDSSNEAFVFLARYSHICKYFIADEISVNNIYFSSL